MPAEAPESALQNDDAGETGANVPDAAGVVSADEPTAEEAAGPARPALPELVGWASVEGRGLATTDGGGRSAAVVAATPDELATLVALEEPLNIAISGQIEVPQLLLTSNKTLFGVGADATLRGGIAIRGTEDTYVSNVILHNLNIDAAISDADGDGVQLSHAHHVWIDHCSIRDAPDGLIDIVQGSDFVTISHTRLFYTELAPDPEHRFASSIGNSIANSAEDAGRLNVTWHHDWWGEGVARALKARFGSVHLFNNVFFSPGSAEALLAGLGVRLLLENNHFEAVAVPHNILPGSSGQIAAMGNIYIDTSGAREVTGDAFDPPYQYAIDTADTLVAIVEDEAGPR